MSGIPSWFVNWFNTTLGGGTTSETAADAAVSISVDNSTPNPGALVTFTITATNNGPGLETGLTIAAPLTSAFQYVSSTAGAGYDPTSGTWNVGTLSSGASATLTLTATAVSAGWDVVTAAITAEGAPDSNTGNNAAAVGIAAPPNVNVPINTCLTADGSNVSGAKSGDYNEEVITGSAAGGIALLQQGYQAAFLAGGAAATLVDTAFGNAMLAGGQGNDTILTAAGNDTLLGGAGNNFIVSYNASALESAAGQSGNNVFWGGNGAVTILGGNGQDTAVMTSGGVIDTGTGGTQVWMGTGNTTVNSNGADTIIGGSGAETVNVLGTSGDLAFTGSGKMLFNGGTGASTVVGLTGSVTVNGGSGGGTFIGGTAGNNVLNSGSGTAVMIGGGTGDVLNATGSANDVLVASAGAETLNAAGSSGNDAFFGGLGSDCIIGGTGQNAFTAGPGNMTLVGGGSLDLYSFVAGTSSKTLIDNFNTSNDYVQLSGFGSNAAQNAIQNAASALGGAGSMISLSDGTQITFANVSVANLKIGLFV